MIAFDKRMSCCLLSCAAAVAAAFTVTGCAELEPERERLDPEPVAEAEAPLVSEERHFTVDLVQLLHDDPTTPNTIEADLVGYGYSQDLGGGKSLQRWVVFKNHEGNNFYIRKYSHSKDPQDIVPDEVLPTLQSWEDLVTAVWYEDSLGTEKRYSVCTSQVYEHGGTYDGVLWRPMPTEPPTPEFPAWEGQSQVWRPIRPNMAQPGPGQPSPLVYPPTAQWIKSNVKYIGQGDPGDGKALQDWTIDPTLEKGWFLFHGSIDQSFNTEYYYMKSAFQTAGITTMATKIEGHPIDQWNGLSAFWDAIEPQWDDGQGVAIVGCINTETLPGSGEF